MENYELASQQVKAVLFDKVYREQGLVDILTRQLESFDPEKQQRLSTLFTKQKEDIENVLGILSEFDIKMKDILATSKEIMEISEAKESSDVHVSLVETQVNSDVGVVENAGVNSETVENAGVNSETVENAEVPVSEEVVTSTETIPTEEVNTNSDVGLVIPGVVVDAATVGGEQVNAPVSAEPGVVTGSDVVSQPVIEIPGQEVKAVEQEPVATVTDTTVVESPVPEVVGSMEQQVVAPTNEVIQIPGQTGSIDEEVPVENTGSFVLSPIDEDVAPVQNNDVAVANGIALADSQLQTIEGVKNEIASDPNLSEEERHVALERYVRATENTVKAILVTKMQYEKLGSSRPTQKALLESRKNSAGQGSVSVTDAVQSNASQVVGDAGVEVKADEQTLIANGLLEPTVQDKQKEMQMMMEQANTLYKAGQTQEAQALFDKVSAMNKEIQAGSSGQMLVKN